MREFKGTPAPWYFSNEGVLRIRAEEDDAVVCSYAGYDYFEEEYANAKLIAAAPDLLEALQKMFRAGQKQNWNERYESEMNAARAAISKALGEE